MREFDLPPPERPTGPTPAPLDPDIETPSRAREAARFALAVLRGAAILSGRILVRRPFATLVALGFLWGSVSVAANLVGHDRPHPRPLFARASEPTPQTTAAPPALQAPLDPIARLVAEGPPAPIPAAAPVDPPPSPRREAARDLVRDLQAALTRRGHYQGPVDGVFGPRTARAIRAGEREFGMAETGQPSTELLARLIAPPTRPSAPAQVVQQPRQAAPAPRAAAPAPAGPEAERARLTLVQRRLAEMGYAPGRPTGEMSPEFKRALERFRGDNDLPPGEVDRALLDRLAAVSGPLS